MSESTDIKARIEAEQQYLSEHGFGPTHYLGGGFPGGGDKAATCLTCGALVLLPSRGLMSIPDPIDPISTHAEWHGATSA